MGKIANECWLAIPDHFPFVRLGNHIIVPNHVHGIIIIDKENGDMVGRQNIASLPYHPDQPRGNRFGPQSQNLVSIVRGFKIGVTKNARLINPEFTWQSRYHDHINRNERSFDRISNYIEENPKRRGVDKFYT